MKRKLSSGLAPALVVALVLTGSAQAAARPEGVFLGTASCAATACHGATAPRTGTRIPQDEYRTWFGLNGKIDKHARAFRVLTEPLGKRIGKWLGMKDPSKEQRCLACHQPPVPKGQRGPLWSESDGVGCEACHGASSAWSHPHANGASHAENVKLGMVDTKNFAVRAAQCLQCHLGTSERRVDHELIAAGHPDLPFEMDTFTSQMPVHWKESSDPTEHVRAWGIAQAVQLKTQFDYVRDLAKSGRWPDYARLDCAACHHPLQTWNTQWRIDQDKNGRKPGRPPFNPDHYLVYRHLVRGVAAKQAAELDRLFGEVYAAMSTADPGRRNVARAAARGSELAAQLAKRMETIDYDANVVQGLLRGIAKDEQIANGGPRAALQAVWAMDLLLRVPHASQDQGGAWPADVKGLLDEMYHHVDHLSTFNGPMFAEQMKHFSRLIEQIPYIKIKK